MKTMKTILPLSLMLVLAACGDKNPVNDIDQLREQGQANKAQNFGQPTVVYKYKDRTVEVPRVEYKESVRVIEQATVNESFFIVTTDPEMTFSEGQKSSFKITARSLVEGVSVRLVARNLPAWAQITGPAADKITYTLTGQPPYSTIPAGKSRARFAIQLSAQVTAAKTEADRQKLNSLVKEKTEFLDVFKTDIAPSDLKIENLPSEVSEDSTTTFQVTAKVPGLDQNSAQKPMIDVYYDGVSTTPGNNFMEQNGTYYINPDSLKQAPEYLGNSTWKFQLVFDTKNNPVQPQKAPNGTVIPNADGTRVRLSFKVKNPVTNTATPEVLRQMKIRYTKVAKAPRFNFSGIKGTSMVLIPGESTRLLFRVESADTKADVKVELPDLSALTGKPTVACKASAQGSYIQECQLDWAVPCEATAQELQQELSFGASAVVDGQTENVRQTLTTTIAKKKSSKCTVNNNAGAKKVEPKKPAQKPAPAPSKKEKKK